MASASRYATSAELIPPDNPRSAFSKPGLPQLAADELPDDAARDVGVDGELRRELEQGLVGDNLQRRQRDPAPRAEAPRSFPRRPPRTRRLGRRLGGRHVQARLGPERGRRIDREARPLRHDALELAHLELGPLVTEQREREPFPSDVVEVHVHEVQPVVVQRRREHGRAGGRDDLRPAPERDRLVHPDPVAEHHERGRQLRVGPHQRPPRRRRPEPHLGRPPRSRPGDDETLISTCAPSSASSWGTVRCQKSSQMAIPIPRPSRDGTARSRSPAAKKRRSSNRP